MPTVTFTEMTKQKLRGKHGSSLSPHGKKVSITTKPSTTNLQDDTKNQTPPPRPPLSHRLAFSPSFQASRAITCPRQRSTSKPPSPKDPARHPHRHPSRPQDRITQSMDMRDSLDQKHLLLRSAWAVSAISSPPARPPTSPITQPRKMVPSIQAAGPL